MAGPLRPGPLRPGPLRLSGNTRIVMQRLADRVNFSSNTMEARSGAWVSRTTLAAGTMSLKTVDRAVLELKGLGLIKVDARFCSSGKSAASQLSNLYTFNSALLDAGKGKDKFKAVVVMPVAGFTWPTARKHGLKKSDRLDGFPSENRCEPRQASVSRPPPCRNDARTSFGHNPPERLAPGPGFGSRKKQEERNAHAGRRSERLMRSDRGQARLSALAVRPLSPALRSRPLS